MIANCPPLTVGAESSYLPADYLIGPVMGPVDPRWVRYPGLKNAVVQAINHLNSCNGWGTYVESVAVVLKRLSAVGDFRPCALLWVDGGPGRAAMTRVRKRLGKIGYGIRVWAARRPHRPHYETLLLTQLQTRTGGVRTIGRVDHRDQGQDGGQP